MDNKSLRNARRARKDEFYTRYEDIAVELVNYTDQLAGKTAYCNCDNPLKSNFVRYFTENFKCLELKSLIVTHYIDRKTTDIKPQKLILTKADNEAGFICKLSQLEGNGDFRSDECLDLLRESDVVVTNPPFSLWREYEDVVISQGKQFALMGIIQAANYTPMLQGILSGTIKAGYTNYNKALKFTVPDNYCSKKIIDGKKVVEVPVCWWTNLLVANRQPLQLKRNYTPEDYPKYEAKTAKGKPSSSTPVDAINVDIVADIPCDYDGLIGVPVTILGKIDYNQFEVVDKVNDGFISSRKVFTRIIIRKKRVPAATTATKIADIFAIQTNTGRNQVTRALPGRIAGMVRTRVRFIDLRAKALFIEPSRTYRDAFYQCCNGKHSILLQVLSMVGHGYKYRYKYGYKHRPKVTIRWPVVISIPLSVHRWGCSYG